MCPHYFIPEINMFENKIEGHERLIMTFKGIAQLWMALYTSV